MQGKFYVKSFFQLLLQELISFYHVNWSILYKIVKVLFSWD